MLKFEERLKAETKKIFGKRVKNDACALCGEKLQAGEYCDCFKSIKINYYYQKVVRKIQSYHYVLTPADEKELQKTLLNGCKIPVKYRGMDFDSYLTDIPAQVKVKDGVFKYYQDGIHNFLTGKNLILTGNYGTGKTMLMSILSNRIIIDYSLRVNYINAVEMVNDIKDSFNCASQKTTKSILQKYKDSDFLFIDDIDKINATDYVRELMYSIVNDRYENELPIVISSNNSIDVLDEKYFGEAVVSRLLERSQEIRFTHKNMRFN